MTTSATKNTRPVAFDEAVLSYKGALAKFVNKNVKQPSRRDDVLQDVLTSIFANWRAFRGNGTADPYGKGSGFRAWMFWQARYVFTRYKYGNNKLVVVYPGNERKYAHLHATPASQECALIARDILDHATGRGGAILLRRAAGERLGEIGRSMGIKRERTRQLSERARAELRKVAA